MSRLRRAAADFGMLFLLPATIALLPWRVGFALLKRLARSPRLLRAATDPAWEAARPYLGAADELDWKFRFRLLRLVDHADVYLALLRGRRWRARNLVAHGDWPAPGAGVLLTFHWGAGWWIWPELGAHGIAAHFLARQPQGRSLGLTRVSHAFGRLREWAMHRSGGAGALFTGGSSAKIAEAFAQRHAVVGMLDLPPAAGQRALPVTVLGREARFPYGLLRLAAAANVPVTLFSVGLNVADGTRDMRIETLPAGLAPEAALARYAAHLDARLRDTPAYWQIWREAAALFTPAAGCAGDAAPYNTDTHPLADGAASGSTARRTSP